MDERQEIRSLKKALRVLRVMNQKRETTVSEISAATGVPRSTTFRLLETLAAEGYVAHQPQSSYYRLTTETLALSSGFQTENFLLEIARPLLSALGARIGWALTLATPRDGQMVVRITTGFDTTLAIERFKIGSIRPLARSTAGLCYLAFCPPRERAAMIATAQTAGEEPPSLALQPGRLDLMMERVRRRGFCNLEFRAEREGSIGVPLLVGNVAFGGITMRYIKSAMTDARLLAEYIPLLQDLSARIAAEFAARTAGADRQPVLRDAVAAEVAALPRAAQNEPHSAAVRGPAHGSQLRPLRVKKRESQVAFALAVEPQRHSPEARIASDVEDYIFVPENRAWA